MVIRNNDEEQQIDLYYHDGQVNARIYKNRYFNGKKTAVKYKLLTRTKCLALSRFSFVVGADIGKHSSLSK